MVKSITFLLSCPICALPFVAVACARRPARANAGSKLSAAASTPTAPIPCKKRRRSLNFFSTFVPLDFESLANLLRSQSVCERGCSPLCTALLHLLIPASFLELDYTAPPCG